MAIVSKVSKSPMQSGVKCFGGYVVRFSKNLEDFYDKNTGYVKTCDTKNQISLHFDSLDLAVSFLNDNKYTYKITDNFLNDKVKKSYSKNFTKDPNLEY